MWWRTPRCGGTHPELCHHLSERSLKFWKVNWLENILLNDSLFWVFYALIVSKIWLWLLVEKVNSPHKIVGMLSWLPPAHLLRPPVRLPLAILSQLRSCPRAPGWLQTAQPLAWFSPFPHSLSDCVLTRAWVLDSSLSAPDMGAPNRMAPPWRLEDVGGVYWDSTLKPACSGWAV